MPNVENIKKAIAVMERVKVNEEKLNRRLFDMRWFRYTGPNTDESVAHIYEYEEIPKIEKDVIHQCGTTCCFAGWIAVAPEFHDEIFCDETGFPQILGSEEEYQYPEKVISGLLDITVDNANRLIYGWFFYEKDSHIPKSIDSITIDDVIERLNSFIKE
jgi:hypothetical protein